MEYLSLLKDVFIELSQRFESTENLKAMKTLLNYFEDYDWGFNEDDVLEIESTMTDIINTIK